MDYLSYLIKKQIYQVVLVGVLLLWAITASTALILYRPEPVLIGIDQNGTRIITETDDPLFRTEVVNFIKRFTSVLYNFDQDTFDENVGLASDLMSKELWEREKGKILELSNRVKSDGIIHSATVQSISKNKEGEFEVVLKTSEVARMRNKDSVAKLRLRIQKVNRTVSNPFGFELTEIEETFDGSQSN